MGLYNPQLCTTPRSVFRIVDWVYDLGFPLGQEAPEVWPRSLGLVGRGVGSGSVAGAKG
jgi:hypothetical protein